MKVCAFGLTEIPLGQHNIKDPRLDETHKLIEAKKKIYAQVEVVGDEGLVDSDCVVTSEDGFLELTFRDVDFIETRLGRDPSAEEREALCAAGTAGPTVNTPPGAAVRRKSGCSKATWDL